MTFNGLDNILEAPCFICGYNGAGYYQSNTHYRSCYWYHVGGLSERVDAFKKALKEKRVKIMPHSFDVEKYYRENGGYQD